jgi:hypothetical protein
VEPAQIHSDTYVSSVFIGRDFETVWQRLTDPLNFSDLYPNWITSVEQIGDDIYLATGTDGDSFTIVPHYDWQFGVVDFELVTEDGPVELASSRLIPVGNACVLVRLVVRSHDMEASAWEAHKRGVDGDHARVKRVLEGSAA